MGILLYEYRFFKVGGVSVEKHPAKGVLISKNFNTLIINERRARKEVFLRPHKIQMNIVVLCGGIGPERDVSITSGAGIANALKARGHRAIVMDLYFGYPEVYENPLEVFENNQEIAPFQVGEAVPDLARIKAGRLQDNDSIMGDNVISICQRADVVFMALHGDAGENGKLQATFDVCGIRYTGSDHLGSALAMNKGLSKELFSIHKIPTPQGRVIRAGEAFEDLPIPCVVKPCSGGSSVGISVVTDEKELGRALEEAFRYESQAVVETYIKGREFAVGVLSGNALPVIEICPKSGYFDYKSKYQKGMSDEYCPADLDADTTQRMQKTALAVYNCLRLEVYARIDFLLDENGAIFCLEANTLPGMTPTSLLPQEAAAAGISYEDLCEEIIKQSMVKYQ